MVLVVEDDTDLRTFVQMMLQRKGNRPVRAAGGPAEALTVLAAEPVDVLVTDLQMPGMTGLQLVEQVREDHPDLPVVLMTAHGTMDVAVQALRHHVDEFLVKPLTAATLVPTVARLAEKGLAAREAARILRDAATGDAGGPDLVADRVALRGLATALGRQAGRDDGLERAAEVQRSLLPRSAPRVPGFDFAGACLPSQAVGGDFFDWQVAGGRVRFTVADVMGKGVAAALLTAAVRAVLRSTDGVDGPAATVTTAADRLHEDLDAAGSFVTLVHGEVDIASGTATLVDAGHGLALLVRSAGGHEQLHGTDLPLGIDPNGRWVEQRRQLEPGDRLIVVSDGVLDLWDGTTAALAELAHLVRAASDCAEVVELIGQRASDGPPADDITVIVMGMVAGA